MTKPTKSPGSYEVGHGKPPITSRFAKGASGNPSGRPKRTGSNAGTSPFTVVFDRTLTVEKDGRGQDISMEQGLHQAVVREAFAIKRSAMRQVMKMIQRREVARAEAAPPRQFAEERYEFDCQASLNEVLLSLGVVQATHHGDVLHLKLHTWAVQLALDRRTSRSPPLDAAFLKFRMVDPGAIVWPGQ